MGTYLTVADLKSYVRSELSVDDGWYDAAISTAEGIINNNTGRQFVVASPTVSTARSYMASDGELLMIHDAAAIVSVVDNGVTLTSGTDYQAEPLNGLSYAGETVPYSVLRRLGYYGNRWYSWYAVPNAATVVVTARWGWSAIPAQIVEACKIIAKDVFLQRDVAHGLIGVSDVGGIGTRENRVVVDAIAAYQHPQGIVVG